MSDRGYQIYLEPRFNGTAKLTLELQPDEANAWRKKSREDKRELVESFLHDLLNGRRNKPILIPKKTKKTSRYQITISHSHRRVLGAIAQRKDDGLTDEEGQKLLGIDGNSYRPLRVDLVRANLVVKSDKPKRRTDRGGRASVWVAVKGATISEE